MWVLGLKLDLQAFNVSCSVAGFLALFVLKMKAKKKTLTNMYFNTWMVSSGYRGITELNVLQACR